MDQMEMQVKVMALELAIKAKHPEANITDILLNAESIAKFIKGE